MPTYHETVAAIKAAAMSINITRIGQDGRIESAMSERPFLEELKRLLPPTYQVEISLPRAPNDVMINGIRINAKLTDCKTADNACNKPSIFWSITGEQYPYASNWNQFLERLVAAKTAGKIKAKRDPMTEYHYLVKNKTTGDVLLKSIFDIHTYVSNPSNDLQINWGNEFAHADYVAPNYRDKLLELIKAIQQSVGDMIERTQRFANAKLDELL